jgi:hypothetical protein
MTHRRSFIMVLGGVLALPRFAFAQQAGLTYRVGWLSASATRTETYNVAFVERLRELGFAERRNLVIEFSRIPPPRASSRLPRPPRNDWA